MRRRLSARTRKVPRVVRPSEDLTVPPKFRLSKSAITWFPHSSDVPEGTDLHAHYEMRRGIEDSFCIKSPRSRPEPGRFD